MRYCLPMSELTTYRIPGHVLADLHEAGSVKQLGAGVTLYHQGQEPHTVYLVLAGVMKLVVVSRSGSQSVAALRGVGNIIGQHGALDDRPRPAGAEALVDSEVLGIATPLFQGLLRTYPVLSAVLLRELSRQMREAIRHIVELSDEHTSCVIARRLLQLAVDPLLAPLRFDERDPIVVQSPMSQRDLAAWAGISERSAGTALQQFRNEGLIATSRLRVEFLDLDGLRAHAGLAARA